MIQIVCFVFSFMFMASREFRSGWLCLWCSVLKNCIFLKLSWKYILICIREICVARYWTRCSLSTESRFTQPSVVCLNCSSFAQLEWSESWPFEPWPLDGTISHLVSLRFYFRSQVTQVTRTSADIKYNWILKSAKQHYGFISIRLHLFFHFGVFKR